MPAALRIVAAVAFAALALPAAASAAKPTPKVSALTASPRVVETGAQLKVAYRVKGRGSGRLTLRLAKGTRPGRGDVVLSRGRVRAGRRTVKVTVPATATAGRYRLLACLRTCRVAKGSVTVHRPVVGGGGTPGNGGGTPGNGGGGAPRGGAPPRPPALDLKSPANPLEVTVQHDAARRVKKTIGTAGGTVEASTASGVKFTLTVPTGALLDEEEISLTPVTAVDGLPLSRGLVAAVQLEPSGLRFARHVQLEITGHPAPPAGQETGFLYQHAGAEFQLYPIDAKTRSRTVFNILHFSGVGVGLGTDADRAQQLLRATQDLEGRLYQALSEVFRHARETDTPPNATAIEGMLRTYHDEALKPLMDLAATDDAMAIQAINRYLGWERTVYLMLGEAAMAAERAARQKQFLEIMKNALLKAHRRCIDRNRPEELPTILSGWRQLTLLGIADELPLDFWDSIRGCARFELDMEVKLHQRQRHSPYQDYEDWKGHAILSNLIIEPDPLTLESRGEKDAEYLDFRVIVPPHEPGKGCWMGGGEWETLFPIRVSRLEMDLNPVQKPDGTYGHPEFKRGALRLHVPPFRTQEWQFYSDCGSSTGGGGWGNWLSRTFFELHMDEKPGTDFVIKDWAVPAGGGSMLGAKVYSRTKNLSYGPTTEDTTLELYHAPQG